MVAAVAKLLSLPFQWLGQLAAMFGLSAAVGLLKLAWFISGDGAVARMALAQILKDNDAATAGKVAAAWMQRRPRPEIASMGGLMALQTGDVESAREYLIRGRSLGDDPAGLFELLQVHIASSTGDVGQMRQAVDSLARRRDLSASVRKDVVERSLWYEMLAGRFEQARELALRLLSIDESISATMALWALAKRRRRDGAMQAHLKKTAAAPPAHRLYFQVLGNVAIGADADARTDLEALGGYDSRLAQLAWALAESRGGVQ